MFSRKNEKKTELENEKKIIKRLEDELEYRRKTYSRNPEENDLVKVFVARRNATGHLRSLRSFDILWVDIGFLEESVKNTYGPGRYCVSLQRGNWRSKGVDIFIG